MKLPKLIKQKNHIPEALRPRSVFGLISRDPHVDWIGSLIITALISSGFIIVGYFNYSSVVKRISEPVSSVKKVVETTLDSKSLNSVIDAYEKKESERGLLLKGYVGSGDPSF